MKLSKKKATLLSILILLGLGVFVSRFIYGEYLSRIHEFSTVPQNIRITNVSDRAFTVSWKTDSPQMGFVVYGKDDGFDENFPPINQRIAVDDRDFYADENNQEDQYKESDVVTLNEYMNDLVFDNSSSSTYYTHHVTVRNLDPESRYFFMVSDGKAYGLELEWFADDEYNYEVSNSVKTLREMEEFTSPYPTYGEVVSSAAESIDDGISFANIQYQDSALNKDSLIPLSSPISEDDHWFIDVSNLRSSDGSTSQFDPDKNFERVFVEAGNFGRSMNYNIPPYEDSPAKPIEVVINLPEGYDDETQAYRVVSGGAAVAGLNTGSDDGGGEQPYSDPSGVIDNNCTGSGGSIGRCDQNHQDGQFYLCTANGWQRVSSCSDSGGTSSGDNGGISDGGSDAGSSVDYGAGFDSNAACGDYHPVEYSGPPREAFRNSPYSGFTGSTSDYYSELGVQSDPCDWGFNGVENAKNGGAGSGCSKGRSCAPGLVCVTCGSETYEGQKNEMMHQPQAAQICAGSNRDKTLVCGGPKRVIDTTPFDYHDDVVQVPWQYLEMAVHCPTDAIARDLQERCTDNFYNNADRCIAECHAINDGCEATMGRITRNCCKPGAITTDPMCDPSHFLYCPEACPNGNPFPDEMRRPYSDESMAWQEENNIKVKQGGTGLGGNILTPANGDWQPREIASIISKSQYENGYEEVPMTSNQETSSIWEMFVSKVNAQESIMLEPKEGVVFLEDAGRYCVQIESEEVCSDVYSPGSKKFFLDFNENGTYEEDVDIVLSESEELVEVTLVEEYFQRFVVRGNNLISLPVLKDDNSQFKASELLELLNEINEAKVLSIATYDTSLGKWLSVNTNHGTTFKSIDFNIVPGKGYLIKSEDTFSFALENVNSVEIDTIYLGTGWNLVGMPNKSFDENEIPSDILISIYDSFNGELLSDNLSQWNRSVSKYEGVAVEYEEDSQSIYGRDFALNDESGYFLKVSDGSGSWTYSSN